LTELGREISEDAGDVSARARAFLAVPLYRAIFDKYKGHLLPPAKALEREMQSLGVSSKQTDKARQAFERSARQAGFHESGDDRLVMPRVRLERAEARESDTPQSRPVDDSLPQSNESTKRGSGGGGDGLHPFIQGLLETLPEPNTVWTIEGRAAWLEAAASTFKLIYKGDGAIKIEATSSKSDGPKDLGH